MSAVDRPAGAAAADTSEGTTKDRHRRPHREGRTSRWRPGAPDDGARGAGGVSAKPGTGDNADHDHRSRSDRQRAPELAFLMAKTRDALAAVEANR